VNDKDVALLRKNLQAEAKQLITKNMQLTDSEAAAFWPLYDQYAAEVRKVNDTRFGLVKQYAKIYKTMTPDEADSLIRLLAEADQTIISLRMQYLPKFEQALPGTKAALFMQLDQRLDSLFNVQIASQLPAIKP
jgi:succinate dehydrogenase flavin-adding protein (antitoxin of CptAB toxin-antitoxin module)